MGKEGSAGRPLRGILHGLRGCLVGIAALLVSFFSARSCVERRGWESIRGPIPNAFPLIVLTRTSTDDTLRAQLVTGEYLQRFLSDHPIHSFAILPGTERDVASQLGTAGDENAKYAGGRWVESFDVKALPSGGQLVTVGATANGDAIIVGCYEATATELMPRDMKLWNHMYEGPLTLLLTLAMTFVVLLVTAVGEWLGRNRGSALRTGDRSGA